MKLRFWKKRGEFDVAECIWKAWYAYGSTGVGTVTVIAPSIETAITAIRADNPGQGRRVYQIEQINERVIQYREPVEEEQVE